jgi:hypothetical protein
MVVDERMEGLVLRNLSFDRGGDPVVAVKCPGICDFCDAKR